MSSSSKAKSVRDLIARKHLASSANKANVLEWDNTLGISLINNTNKAGITNKEETSHFYYLD